MKYCYCLLWHATLLLAMKYCYCLLRHEQQHFCWTWSTVTVYFDMNSNTSVGLEEVLLLFTLTVTVLHVQQKCCCSSMKSCYCLLQHLCRTQRSTVTVYFDMNSNTSVGHEEVVLFTLPWVKSNTFVEHEELGQHLTMNTCLSVHCSRPSQQKQRQPSCPPCYPTQRLCRPTWGRPSPPPRQPPLWACTSRSSAPPRMRSSWRRSCARRPCSPWRPAPSHPSWWALYPVPIPHPRLKTRHKISPPCLAPLS